MTRRPSLTRRLACGLSGLGGARLGRLHRTAQSARGSNRRRRQLPRLRGAPPIYRAHRSIRIDTSAAVRSRPTCRRATAAIEDSQGLARSIQVDARVQRSVLAWLGQRRQPGGKRHRRQGRSGKPPDMAHGLSMPPRARAVQAALDLLSRGREAWSRCARTRACPSTAGGRRMSGLGDLNSPDIALARLQPRFYLPTGPMQGAVTEWRGPFGLADRGGRRSAGPLRWHRRAEFPYPRRIDRHRRCAEWSPAHRIGRWGGQFIEAHDVNLAIGPLIDGNVAAVVQYRPHDGRLGRPQRTCLQFNRPRWRCRRQGQCARCTWIDASDRSRPDPTERGAVSASIRT